MDITQELFDYIVTTFEIDTGGGFDADVNIFDFGYVDSLGAVKIIAELESRYGIEITQRDLMLYPMSTVSEIAAVVKTKIGL
jgi:D-alanine--poly(phosphoribitol) ligase subunit 2